MKPDDKYIAVIMQINNIKDISKDIRKNSTIKTLLEKLTIFKLCINRFRNKINPFDIPIELWNEMIKFFGQDIIDHANNLIKQQMEWLERNRAS